MDEIRNNIITISGEPSSGKSTVIRTLQEKYTKMGYTVHIEPVGHYWREAAVETYKKLKPEMENVTIDEIHVDPDFETFRKQNVNFVEILFSEYYFVEDHYRNYWTKLRSLGEELTHCHPSQTVRTMSGMSMEKKKALCHPYPTIKDKIDKYQNEKRIKVRFTQEEIERYFKGIDKKMIKEYIIDVLENTRRV